MADPASALAGAVYPTLINPPPPGAGLAGFQQGGRLPSNNPFLAGVGGPQLTDAIGGSGMGASSYIPSLYKGQPDPGAGGATFSGDTQPPPDPNVDAANKIDQELAKVQADLLKQERSLLGAEDAFGAKMMKAEESLAASMQPFKPPASTPPMQQWGSMAMMVAVFGSMFTRQPLTSAMNAMAGVLNGFRKGDQEAIDMAYQTWKANSDQALKLANFEMQAYQNAIGVIKDKLAIGEKIAELEQNEVMAKIYATSGALGDNVMGQLVTSGHLLPTVMDALTKRQAAITGMAKAQTEAEQQILTQKAWNEFKNDPANQGKSNQELLEAFKQINNQYFTTPATPEDIHKRALQKAAGLPSTVWAGGLPYSGAGAAARIAISNEASRMTPDEIEAAKSDPAVTAVYQAQSEAAEMRRLGGIRAGIEVRANNALQASSRVLASSNAVPRGTFLPANFATMTLQEMQSDPRLRTYYINMNSFITEYAAALNNGQPRVYDKQHAVELINKYGSVENVEAAMKALQAELRIALNSPGQLERIRTEHPDEPIGDLLWKQEQESEAARGLGGGGFTASPVGGGGAGGGAPADAGFSAVVVP